MIRHVLGLLFLCGSMVCNAASAQERDWPQQPIRILVALAAGGLPDSVARIIAPHLSAALGQPVVVENRPGAAGNIAARAVAKSEPNGYTLLLGGLGLAVNPTLAPDPSFDYARDFAPISMLAEGSMVLVATPSFPARNITEFIAVAKEKPGAVSIAISAIGTPNHLGPELLAQMAGVDVILVPYTGISPALSDLMAGRVQLTIGAIPSVMPHVANGTLKALAVTQSTRSSFAPEVPSADEAGLPGFGVNLWICLVAASGTPPAIIQKLNTEVRKIMALPEVRERFARLGAEPSSSSPEALAEHIKAQTVQWSETLKRARVK